MSQKQKGGQRPQVARRWRGKVRGRVVFPPTWFNSPPTPPPKRMKRSQQSSHDSPSQLGCYSPSRLTYEVTHRGSIRIAVTLPKRHGSSKRTLPGNPPPPPSDSTRSVPEAPPLCSSAPWPPRGARRRAGRGPGGLGAPAARSWRFPLRVTLGGLRARVEWRDSAPRAWELRAQLQQLHRRAEDRSSLFGE